jgi:Ca2+-binding RTX toxin-like protein
VATIINLSGQPNGVYTIEDDGIAGNGTSVLRGPDGTILATFAHPADALSVISRAGQSVNVNITDSLTTANVTIGSLTTPDQNPDNIQIGSLTTSGIVTLAARGSISELGSDGGSDIVAGRLFMDAGTGIGALNAIETQISVLEAESVTGGINLSNIGDVTIGGAALGSADLRGLFTGTSGNITLVNEGSITLSDEDGIESVHSAGGLTLSAIGATADISSNVDQDALLAVGNIFLNAGRDVLFGTVGTDFDNDVRSGAGIFVSAGRDFHIDGFSDLAANDMGLGTNGGVTITAGRDILVDDQTGTDASIGVSSGLGGVVLTTGVGGTLVLHATSTAALFAGSGGVTVNADRMLIEADSGITTSNGGVVTLTTASAGRDINLGVATDGVTALELSDAELDRIFASNLVVGSATAGTLTVAGALTLTSNDVTLQSGGDVSVNANVTAPQFLAVKAGENFNQLIGTTISAGTLTVFVDTPDTDTAGGTAIFGGTVFAPTTVHGNADNDALYGTNGVDLLDGLGGDDFLDGGAGPDDLRGGTGNDTYVVDNAFDVVTEADGAGNDLIYTTVDYTLGAFSFVETLSARDVTSTNALNLFGNGQANTLIGNNGANFLDGGGGADVLRGFGGNDSYAVDSSGDLVVEDAGGGTDTIYTTVDYALSNTSFVEILSARDVTSTNALNLFGNDQANTLIGNNGANFLDGGGGADVLRGFGGNDTYAVDNSGDVVLEVAGAGNDTVYASVDYTLGASSSIETLSARDVTSTSALNLFGNELANTLIGNNGANFLDGGAGIDTLRGFAGDDSYGVDSFSDGVIEAAGGGNDTVYTTSSYMLGVGQEIETLSARDVSGTAPIVLVGNEFANAVIANNGANILNGGGGADTLRGFGGADRFDFSTALGAGNIDTILDMTSGTDKIGLDDAIFTAIGATLDAGEFVVGAAAGDADDRIIYNQTTGQLFYDADGNGAGAAVQFATLAGTPAITVNDFTVF